MKKDERRPLAHPLVGDTESLDLDPVRDVLLRSLQTQAVTWSDLKLDSGNLCWLPCGRPKASLAKDREAVRVATAHHRRVVLTQPGPA